MVRCPWRLAAAREEGVVGDVGDGSGRLEKLKGASRGDGGATGAVSWGMASDGVTCAEGLQEWRGEAHRIGGVSGEEVSERVGKMKPRECLRSRGGVRVLLLGRACSLASGEGRRWRVCGAATTGWGDGISV